MKNNKSHILMLLCTAFFWGTTFVAQSIGAGYVGTFTFLAGRSWIAVVCLSAVVYFRDKIADKQGTDDTRPKTEEQKKVLITAGIICGISLLFASGAQQLGMAYTTASKAGFITTLYVILVPIASIFIHKKPSAHIWLCVLLSLVGMYLLCMTRERLSLSLGDTIILVSALLFTGNIMIVDHFSPLVDGVRMSRLQFVTLSVLSTVLMFVFEQPSIAAIKSAVPAMLYAGVFSSSIAFTFQIIGQRDVDPTVATLVMSLESVFSALAGWLVLHEQLSGRELLGCTLMFTATLLAQIEFKPKKKV